MNTMNALRSGLLVLVATSLAGCLPATVTGTLVGGTEDCLLLESDAGTTYFVENTGDFGDGDRVTAVGLVDGDCVTTCQAADYCLRDNTIRAADDAFRACGELVQATECVLFETDDGPRYLLENTADFVVGDRVEVAGTLNPQCVTTCLAGEGCIEDNAIGPCD